jgi:hypothetical protein
MNKTEPSISRSAWLYPIKFATLTHPDGAASLSMEGMNIQEIKLPYYSNIDANFVDDLINALEGARTHLQDSSILTDSP